MFVFLILRFIGEKVTPLLLESSELKIESISSYVANQALSDILKEKDLLTSLYETVKSSDGSIQTIDFNPIAVNTLLSTSINQMIELLKKLETGDLPDHYFSRSLFSETEQQKLRKGIIQEFPIGMITGNPLLSNLGPKIPIRVHYLGDVLGNITTDIKSYGINNAMIEVNLHFELTVQILLPYLTEEKKLSFEIPLSIQMITGKIPTYYGGEIHRDSNLYTLPIN